MSETWSRWQPFQNDRLVTGNFGDDVNKDGSGSEVERAIRQRSRRPSGPCVAQDEFYARCRVFFRPLFTNVARLRPGTPSLQQRIRLNTTYSGWASMAWPPRRRADLPIILRSY